MQVSAILMILGQFCRFCADTDLRWSTGVGRREGAVAVPDEALHMIGLPVADDGVEEVCLLSTGI